MSSATAGKVSIVVASVQGCELIAFGWRRGYFPSMPFKHNAARRHRILRARYRITNWPAYKAGLRRRGDLMLWLDEAALAVWAAPKPSGPGGQPLYSDLAIEMVCLQMTHSACRGVGGCRCPGAVGRVGLSA